MWLNLMMILTHDSTRHIYVLQDNLSDAEDNNTDQPVTSQPTASVAMPMPMPEPTEKTNLQETGPIPTYGVDH